jgi:predicted permease
MFSKNLRIAFRQFKNHKWFTAINVLGLAIGISAALVIYLVVQYEFSYEKSWKDGDRIYRVTSEIRFPGMTMHNSGVSIPTADAVRFEATGVDAVTHLVTVHQDKLTVPASGAGEARTFKKEKGITFADSSFFQFFSYDFLAGNPGTALAQPFKAVLTESAASRYFAGLDPEDVVGKSIYLSDTMPLTVSAVVKDLDAVTGLSTYSMFISRATIRETGLRKRWSWESWNNINSSSQLFVKLKSGMSSENLLKQLTALREKYREREEGEEEDQIVHALQPLYDIHFNPDYGSIGGRKAHRPTLWGLIAVAIFLLLLGCINFINLSTAQASTRAKEIGIRKTLGSGRKELITQFLTETLLLTAFATAISVAMVPWLLHVFADFIPPEVNFSSINQVHVWLFLLGLLLLVTLIAGIYPAWVLTRFKPVTVLKNQLHSASGQSRKAWLRKALTVTQFVIAQFLLIATLVVVKQVHYSLNKDLGYSQEAIVSFSTPYDPFVTPITDKRLAFLYELQKLRGIKLISLADGPPASNSTSSTTMTYTNGEKKTEAMVEVKYADTNYFRLFNMNLLAGRNLLPSDTTRELVVNEAFTRAMGFARPQDAVGSMVDRNGLKPIVGVLADFHTKSTHAPIEPLAYSAAQNRCYEFHLELERVGAADEWKTLLASVETLYKKHFPEEEFSYRFFDEEIAAFYVAEKNISRLLQWATGLCVLISCLGLLGLVIFVTNSRVKEIGVRKVLGASVSQIVGLLSRDFLLLVLIAFVIATPLAWWAMQQWLQDFVYRTTLSWWIFAIGGAGMMLIALLVLSIRTIQSAMANPVKSLRTE